MQGYTFGHLCCDSLVIKAVRPGSLREAAIPLGGAGGYMGPTDSLNTITDCVERVPLNLTPLIRP